MLILFSPFDDGDDLGSNVDIFRSRELARSSTLAGGRLFVETSDDCLEMVSSLLLYFAALLEVDDDLCCIGKIVRR
jgi:hypothetical protein